MVIKRYISLTLFFSLFFLNSCDSKKKMPNIVFILVDDLGWNDLGYTGSDFYESPNIDLLSQESFHFLNAYSSSPVCSPTRAAIMTGKHPARINITDWIPGVDPKDKLLLGPKDLHALPLNEKTIAEFLKEGGYNTFYVGKWHLGSEGFYPENNGFDINIGGFEKGSPMGGYYSPYKNPKLSNGPEGEYLTDRLTNESIELIKNNNSSQPFALFLSYYNVHTPIQANKKYLEYFDNKLSQIEDNLVRTKKEGKAISRLNQTDSKYASMVYAVDQNIGKLIKNLKENNLYDNTMIVFTSDNGGLSTQKKIAPTSVYPLRAGKGWLYEGGIKIPQLIKVPGISNNTKIYDLTVSHDLFPTILDFSGIKYNIEVDGISLKPIIENKDKTKREEIFWYYPHYHGSLWKPGSAIRYKNWKLVLHYETESSELFDLEDDPGELNDLSLEFPQIKNNLLNKIDKIIKETDAKLVSKNENYIID